jgi:hypothetical protein
MTNSREVWQRIDGMYYAVSTHGRVRRCEPGKGTKVGRVLKPGRTKKGYRLAHLFNGNDTAFKYVHRLVLETFGPPRPSPKHGCNHIDGDKENNHIDNLEWATPGENSRHAVEVGLIACGEDSHAAKLTSVEVRAIRERYAAGGVTQSDLADEYGVHQTTVHYVIKRRTWAGNRRSGSPSRARPNP